MDKIIQNLLISLKNVGRPRRTLFTLFYQCFGIFILSFLFRAHIIVLPQVFYRIVRRIMVCLDICFRVEISLLKGLWVLLFLNFLLATKLL